MKIVFAADVFDCLQQGALVLGENIYASLSNQSLKESQVRQVFDLSAFLALETTDIFGDTEKIIPFIRCEVSITEIEKKEYDLVFVDSELYNPSDFKKSNLEIEKKKKIDTQVLALHLNKYLEEQAVELKPSFKKQLLNLGDPITQVNALSVAHFLEPATFSEYLESITEQSTPLFWLQLNEANTKNQVKQWTKQIGEEEVQLAISLASTQLQKAQGTYRIKGMNYLIETDAKLKSTVKISPLTAFRYFLYRMNSV